MTAAPFVLAWKDNSCFLEFIWFLLSFLDGRFEQVTVSNLVHTFCLYLFGGHTHFAHLFARETRSELFLFKSGIRFNVEASTKLGRSWMPPRTFACLGNEPCSTSNPMSWQMGQFGFHSVCRLQISFVHSSKVMSWSFIRCLSCSVHFALFITSVLVIKWYWSKPYMARLRGIKLLGYVHVWNNGTCKWHVQYVLCHTLEHVVCKTTPPYELPL